MTNRLQPGEIAVVLKPVVDDDGDWTGAVATVLAFGEEYCAEGMHEALNIAITLASVPQMLEDNPDIEDLLEDYKVELLKETFPEAWAEANEELTEQENEEPTGNVVQLNRWTRTQGSA